MRDLLFSCCLFVIYSHAAVPWCWTLIKLNVFHRNIVIWIFDWLSGRNSNINNWLDYIALFEAPKALCVAPLFIQTTFTISPEYLNSVTHLFCCESCRLWFNPWSLVTFKTPVRTHKHRTIFIPWCPWHSLWWRSSCLLLCKRPLPLPDSLRGRVHSGRSLRQRVAGVQQTAHFCTLLRYQLCLCLSVAWLMDWAQWKQRALRIHLGSWHFFMYEL